MLQLSKILDDVRNRVKQVMAHVAVKLDALSSGHISPNTVTLTGLVAHLPIAWLIAVGQLRWAGLLLIIFGLFDTLDGALARVQNRESGAGMLLDASSDRLKEVLLYIGVGEALYAAGHQQAAGWAAAALGGSLLVSYVKAKGETAIASTTSSPTAANRIFQDGLMRFEVRITILIIGLLAHQLLAATIMVATLSVLTAVTRLARIMGYLERDKA